MTYSFQSVIDNCMCTAGVQRWASVLALVDQIHRLVPRPGMIELVDSCFAYVRPTVVARHCLPMLVDAS
jgi:hypothetical protein